MKPFPELDLLQSAIPSGLTVVEASAGTGKTYSISHLVPRLLLQGDIPDLSSLLLVTFTKDAARELAERVRRVLTRLASPPEPDDSPHLDALRALLSDPAARTRLGQALADLDLLSVSTIHAFCQRTLQQEGTLCGLPVMPEVITDDREHLDALVREQWFATLAADPVIAALATARKWTLPAALDVINLRRRCHHPRTEPATPPYDKLRQQILAGCKKLADKKSQADALDLVRQVRKWNRDVQDADDAMARLQPLLAGEHETLAYWQSVEFAQGLPENVNGVTDKALKKDMKEHEWFTAARQLGELAGSLEWAWQTRLADDAIPQLARTLDSRRLITQDGLIGTLHRALHRTGEEGSAQSERLADHLAGRYHAAIIDESQDTDPRQFAIFRRIFLESAKAGQRRLILVGDPKQAIYGFRGADLATYLAARREADRRYTLTQTHRAPPDLVQAINTLFDREGAFHHPELQFQPAQSALTYDRQLFRDGRPCSRLEAWIAPEDNRAFASKGRRSTAISASIATTIVDLLRHGELRQTGAGDQPAKTRRVTPGDFAVLVSTNAQAEAMAEALQARAVPAVVNSGSDVFASDEARELHLLLQAVLDPRRTRRLRGALATRLLGLDATQLARLDQPADSGGEQPSVTWLERFTRWNHIWTTRGLAALLAELERQELAVTHRLATIPLTGERRATNHRHLTDLLQEAAREEAPRPSEIVRWLGQRIARATERSQVEEHQLQLSSDRDAVQVVTMHKAKGLEYPLVFCPYLADSLRKAEGLGQIPASRSDEKTDADLLVNLELLDKEARQERARQLAAASMEESLRLAYVALTRAQVRAWICSYGNPPRYDQGSPLDWLLRAPEEIATHPRYSDAWVDAAKTGRHRRHISVLQSLGAVPADEGAVDAPAPLMIFRAPPAATPDHHSPAEASTPAGASLAPLPPPPVPEGWRITSFSTLTREKHAHGPSLPSVTAPPEPTAQPAVADPTPAFFTAPGGAAVGTLVHDWIEAWDFSPPAPKAIKDHLATSIHLPPPAANAPSWEDILGELLQILPQIRLPGCGSVPLRELCPEPHGSEWHFHLPLAGELSVAKLARCFAEHAAPAHRPYAAILQDLSGETFRGLLQGFIDRLARHGPHWGVIDWKTNRLGPSLRDYDEAGLLRCAMQDHYLLQTHLYLVALRRYLRALGLDSPPIAGAWLVFLRAIAPASTRGVLHIDPPAAMLDALDELFAPAAHVTP